MADLIVDSDILIDFTRGIQDAAAFLQHHEQQSTIGISNITAMELLVGCRNKVEQQHIDRFLKRFEFVHVNELVSERALALIRQYRLSHGLLMADALIAATAICINQPLATKNLRDYRFVSGLQLLKYP